MKQLLKKEFYLCIHLTAFVFLVFSLFVFIPNYPYEVMFFFSGLSAFFISLTARENGDLPFTCAMPVKRSRVPIARILIVTCFQCALVLLAGITVAIKERFFPYDLQMNLAGSTANLAFLGYGLSLLGIFNALFFPVYYKKPERVGIPFLIASAAMFLCIAILIVLRFSVPLFRDILSLPDPAYMGAKCAAFFIGLALYVGFTLFAAYLSAINFRKVDL